MASDVWELLQLGERIADDLRAMVAEQNANAARSLQDTLGPSEIGKPCTRCLARHVLGLTLERSFTDPWCAIIGTATHAWLDEAAVGWNVRHDAARWIPEQRVQPDPDLLPNGGRCDVYDNDTHTVIDHKVIGTARLRAFKANGPGPTYRRQGHLYGKGYALAGYPVQHVAVAFWHRGGTLRDLYVWCEPYDESVADEALTRYRTIRDQALAIGPAIIPLLPNDPDCYDCGGKQ